MNLFIFLIDCSLMNIGAITIETNNVTNLLRYYMKVLEISDEKIERDGAGHAGFQLDNTYFGFDMIEDDISIRDREKQSYGFKQTT